MRSRPNHRRLLLPALVAIAVATAASGTVLALGRPEAGEAAPVETASIPAVSVPATPPALYVVRSGAGKRATSAADRRQATAARLAAADPIGSRRTTPTAQIAQPKAAASTPAAPKASGSSGGGAATATYRGRNHVWIPSLGISRSIEFFPCSRTKPPGHQIYSWGCAGRNNVYLFGHAASVMKPLHDAYYSKRLKVGMKVIYADGNGRVRTYKVSFWKVVSPVDAGWAFAAQSRPSMTLQTCVGARSQWRLVVRLVQSG